MNKWDVVLLRYPFTDLTATKVRPALVISPDSYNALQDATVIAITSNVAGPRPYDIQVFQTHAEFALTGLRCNSLIRLNKIFTLDQTLMARKLGVLGEALQRQVKENLADFFELAGNS